MPTGDQMWRCEQCGKMYYTATNAVCPTCVGCKGATAQEYDLQEKFKKMFTDDVPAPPIITPVTEVGVIVGRFQCSYVHAGYKTLFEHVLRRHPRVLVFIGNSPLKGAGRDPLDYNARRMMIQSEYRNVEIYPMNDVGDVDRWSKLLDGQIASIIGPMQKVVLYGSRDKFKYNGRYPVEHVEDTERVSSTEIRKQLGLCSQNTQSWREGAIWLSQNRFPICYPTVDIAAIDLAKNIILLGRKPGETLWRFPGGFADVSSPSYEIDALRELTEETSLEGTNIEYIGSALIDDWRYRFQVDKIKTLFYAVTSWTGEAKAADDLAEVQWFTLESVTPDTMLMKNHRILWTMLLNWRDKLMRHLEQVKKSS